MSPGVITRRDIIVALLLVSFGYLTRVVPHMANFSPMIGLAVFSGFYFRRNALSLIVPLVTIFLTDMAIGFYDIMIVIWASYLAMSLLTRRFMKQGSTIQAAIAGLGGASLFFVVTNFAVWASGQMYVMSLQGLVDCYVAAIPFFRNTLVSGVVYSVIFFGVYGFYEVHLKTKQLQTEPHTKL